MIIRTFRDVENELRKLAASINEIPAIKENGGLNSAQVIALINTYSKRQVITNTIENTPQDLDSTNAGTEIIHKLIHRFLEKVIIKELSVDDMAVLNLMVDNLNAANLITSPPSIIGQVLTAIDTIGTAAWQDLPTSNVGTLIELATSAGLAFPAGSWLPVTGLSYNFISIGVYMITTNYYVISKANDTGLGFGLQVSGSASAPAGNVVITKPVAEERDLAIARSWRIEVTSLPATVAAITTKTGSGGSFIVAPCTMQVQRVS